jgi:hypothetical protein
MTPNYQRIHFTHALAAPPRGRVRDENENTC